MARPPIRTITVGIDHPHPLPSRLIEQTATAARRAHALFTDAGYLVQTVRLTTRPVLDDLADWPAAEVLGYVGDLQPGFDRVGLDFVSLGPANAAHPDFPLDRIAVLEDILVTSATVSCAVMLATAEHGIRTDAAHATADVILGLAERTQEGLGNFRFAVLAGVGPGHPFFPASYHAGSASLAVGLQGAGTVARRLSGDDHLDLASITRRVREGLVAEATPVVRLAKQTAAELGFRFGGIDLSPAPGPDSSIVAAIECCGAGPIGSPGTIAVAGALTEALRTTGLPTCGYNGLMLPVLEDSVLAQRWAQGNVTLPELLSYSAVCGTGLDTVPLPGDTSADHIAGVLLDIATMAVRLDKPLSARLFPVPGKTRGDHTTFTSPYLVNTVLR